MKRDPIMVTRNAVSGGRRNHQRGNEMIEFALYACFIVPLFLWVFVNGMNILRLIQSTEITRDIGTLYIHGVDYSTYSAQQVAQRLAKGYGLQIGSSFTGNSISNTSNSGNGYILVSEVMYAGSGSCGSLNPCNLNKYVFLQRIGFGNSSVQFNSTTVQSALGTPTATINSQGYVQNYLGDAGAVASNMSSLLQTQLTDGQVIYVAETFFASTDLGLSAYPAGGVYSRVFF